MAGKSETPFAKDFGYLRPFLDKVEEHARGLDGPRGARLRTLLDGEGARWDEIASLLAGAEPATPAGEEGGEGDAAEAAETTGPSDSTETTVPREEMARGEVFGLTVGSLRGDRRRSS